jgi:hypothetical protein
MTLPGAGFRSAEWVEDVGEPAPKNCVRSDTGERMAVWKAAPRLGRDRSMSQKWYARIDGVERGPLTGHELKQLAADGTLRPTHSVRVNGQEGWRPASAVKGLFADQDRPVRTKPVKAPPVAARPVRAERTARADVPASPPRPSSPLVALKEHLAIIALSMFCCFPAGLALVWTHRSWSVRTKSIWTGGVLLVLFMFAVVGGNQNRTGPAGRAEPLDVAIKRGSPGAWGCIDSSGRVVVPFEYQDIGAAGEGLLWMKKGNKSGYIDPTGREVVPAQFEYAGPLSSGMARVMKDDRWGYVDSQGKQRIECLFDQTDNFAGDFAWVVKAGEGTFIDKTGGKWGLKGPDGKWVVNPQYEAVGRAGPKRWIVLGGSGTGLIDDGGKPVVPLTERFALLMASPSGAGYSPEPKPSPGEGDKLIAFLDGRTRLWGWIDQDGNEVIPALFSDPAHFENGLAVVKPGFDVSVLKQRSPELAKKAALQQEKKPGYGKAGFIDSKGKWVIEPQFDDARPFSDGLAAAQVGVAIDGKWGFIDRTGKFVIDPKFDEVGDFSEGLAWVKTNNSVGFIDKQGQVVIPPVLGKAKSFSLGVAVVQRR